ncbi:MAG TPA: acyl-CoA dehydrogenase family protein, partial [Petrotogaceae bacterium]|nr:acyl-CoA dehydrogenase family protein [Petrotogaceae bacterium]
MDFNLTKEQLMVKKMIRAFTENEVKPLAAEVDETERFPQETVDKMKRYGLLGMCMPKNYGGAG